MKDKKNMSNNYTEEEKIKILNDFFIKLSSDQEDSPIEITESIAKNFWDLI